MKIKLEFKWQDMWIGVYNEIKIPPLTYCYSNEPVRHIWICIIPCLPIHIWWTMKRRKK